jgi:hypothetical protein
MDSSSGTALALTVKRFASRGAILVALSLLAYLSLIYDRVSPYIGGSDSSGYYNLARLLNEGRIAEPQRVVKGLEPGTAGATIWTYMPLGFREHLTPGHIVPGYPTGLPLLMLATATFTGWDFVPGYTAGWNMLLGVLLFFGLGRLCGLAAGWAWFGSIVFGLSPLYLSMGLQPMSDVPAHTWCAATLFFALLSDRDKRWAVASGFALGVAVLIRPTDILIALPVAIVFGIDVRRWLALGIGGLPAAVFLCVYNHYAYGAMLTTGYGDMSEAFGLVWLKPTLLHYARWLPLLFTPLILLAVLLPFQRAAAPRRITWVLLSWAVIFLAFYSVYMFTQQVWWYLRFIIPAMPPLIIGGLLVLQRFTEQRNWPLFAPKAPLLFQVISLLLVFAVMKFHLHHARSLAVWNGKPDDRSYHKTAAWLEQHAPANSIVTTMQSSGSVFAYTDFTVVRWDCVAPQTATALLDHVNRQNRPLYAVLYPFEQADAFKAFSGRWREVFNYREARIWRYEGPPLASP